MNRNIFRNLKKIILGLNVQIKNGRLKVLTQKLDHLRNKNILVLGSSDNPSLPKNIEDYEIDDIEWIEPYVFHEPIKMIMKA
jgi:hypothetical protein